MKDKLNRFPAQQLSMRSKRTQWRKDCVDYGADKATISYSPVRKSVIHKKINYDLLNGVIHMRDLQIVLNPDDLDASFVPQKIQHFPIMNSKLNVLRGEESKRPFDHRVIVTNPNAISEIEKNKRDALIGMMRAEIENTSQSEDELNKKMEEISDYFNYEWQDACELQANELLNHYWKEYNMPLMFNHGFMDACTVGEEIYQCSIVGGEPTIERLNPCKVRVFKSGYSNRIEDADMIVIEDYWSPGKVLDVYYDQLKPADRAEIEKYPDGLVGGTEPVIDAMGNVDERPGFVNATHMIGDAVSSDAEGYFFPEGALFGDSTGELMPYDMLGNIRVVRVYWKSKRKIKKIKHYDPVTGEELYDFYDENYVANTDLGEEETVYWVNQAWQGTKIGKNIYVDMRPCPVQYNRLDNPSKCHFGIVGSIYNLNEDRPFSLVDMMKQYNYLYDAIHDRLNRLISRNWGKIIQLDLAKVPDGWNVSKWMYYAKTNNLAVVDSFKEGNIGASMGKLAGGLNNASSGVIDADFGNNIQQYIALLEHIKEEMAEIAGISKQREGQISNRETVGGVERATLQSSYITEWLFTIHDDVKKRAVECFLDTARIAAMGNTLKFQNIQSDYTRNIVTIDGDAFAAKDYGIVVDTSGTSADMHQRLDTLAQAALQNQALSFGTIMKLYGSASLSEKQRFIEKNEQEMMERQQQQQQAELQAQQEAMQQQLQQKELEMQQRDAQNVRDNETKIQVAMIQAQAQTTSAELQADGWAAMNDNENTKAELQEKKRQFDGKMKLEERKLNLTEQKNKKDAELKLRQINKPTKSSTK